MDSRKRIEKSVRGASAGFTLVELLLVIVILGVLAAMVVPQFAGQGESARISTTRSSISGIATAVNTYEIQVGRFPDSLDDLTVETDTRAALLKKDNLADAWGNAFAYKKTSKFSFEIRSAGPDGQMGTDDDITN
jgi:general secretion pathway protein G